MDRIDTLTVPSRSYTDQLLTAIADQLNTGHPNRVLTPRVFGEAIAAATHLVVDHLPPADRAAALAGVMRTGIDLHPQETASQRALRFRTAADDEGDSSQADEALRRVRPARQAVAA